MFRNMSIRKRIIVLITSTIFIVSMINTLNYINALHTLSSKNIKYFKERSYSDHKQALENYSDMALKTIQYFYQKIPNGANDEMVHKIQQKAFNAIKRMQYGKNGYFWINDLNYKMLMHPIKPEFDNKTFVNTPKVPFVELGVNKLKKTNKKSDFIEYNFLTPSTGKYSHKLSIVSQFKPWGWVIGTGVYTDDIDQEIARKQNSVKGQIKGIVIKSIVIAIVLMFMMSFIVGYISNETLTKPIKNFEKGLLEFFDYLSKKRNDIPKLDDHGNDEISNMAKIINKNVEISQKNIQQNEAFIADIKYIVTKINEGNLSVNVTKSTDNKHLMELKNILNEMTKTLSLNVDADINKITYALESYKELDFTHQIDNPTGKISQGLNELVIIINQLLRGNYTNSAQLEKNANILTTNMKDLSLSSNQQSTSLKKTALAINEISTTISNTNEHISQVAEYSNELTELTNIGKELAKLTVKDMVNINEQTKAISSAIESIDKITLQTNILSLNAAVEASTAGEAGKGFAVVAHEVRNLASQTSQVAKKIRKLVEEATEKTDTGKQNADKMITGYEKIFEGMKQSTLSINNIASVSKEQKNAIKQINDAINVLEHSTVNNAKVASKTEEIANSTNKIAKTIVKEVKETKFIS